jgi:hypothetical protein
MGGGDKKNGGRKNGRMCGWLQESKLVMLE